MMGIVSFWVKGRRNFLLDNGHKCFLPENVIVKSIVLVSFILILF